MEDIIKALLDVVRAQHSATEGSEEKPFDINDIIDMALNISGRPEEPEEQQELSDTIQRMAESLAPDIFPPKTFEEMDDSERAASAVNMIEERLKNGGRRRENASAQQSVQEQNPIVQQPNVQQENVQQGIQSPLTDMQPQTQQETMVQPRQEAEQATQSLQQEAGQPEYMGMAGTEDYGNGSAYDMYGTDDVNHQEAANLNDLIYNNFMQMMGLNDPKVEYPFDRSQIRYGREKTATEMLAEDEANKAEERELEAQRRRPVSAWELAQAAVDKDEEAHQKEEYEPKEMKMPETKSASQLAAEAIAKAKEEDQMKLEAEKRAERLMEEARKRGKDPMEFALHQQEILNYMEKNSDELVSFEDYEDLSPEEKLEIERQLYREKQLEAGVAPEDISEELPDEIIAQTGILPQQEAAEVDGQQAPQTEESVNITGGQAGGQPTQTSQAVPAFSDDMLRMISQEVVQENAEMILAEDANADLERINESIFENLKRMMSQSGGAVTQEDMESLIGEVISRNTSSDSEEVSVQTQEEETTQQSVLEQESSEQPVSQPLSAVELARAAQQAARPEPKEIRETKSAVELAKEAQESAAQKKVAAMPEEEDALSEDDLNFDEFDMEEEQEKEPSIEELKAQLKAAEEALAAKQAQTEETVKSAPSESVSEAGKEESETPEVQMKPEEVLAEADQSEEQSQTNETESSEKQTEASDMAEGKDEDISESELKETNSEEPKSEEFEYVDPGELVLGEHTQAEIDEALENLASLGLEGEVYERAKRMLLLELAGSEVALDAWLEEQENGKKKKAAVSALDSEDEELTDLEDLDEDDLERELELAMDEDFVEEELEEEQQEETAAEKREETAEESETTSGNQEQEEEIVEQTDISSENEKSEEKAEESEEIAESENVEEKGGEPEVSDENEMAEEAQIEIENTAEKATKEMEQTDKEESEEAIQKAEESEEVKEQVKESDRSESSKLFDENVEPSQAERVSEVSEEAIQVEKTKPEKEEKTISDEKKSAQSERRGHARKHKNVVKRKEKAAPEKEEREFSAVIPTGKNVEEKEFQVSVRNPFVLKNSASFMDKFEEYIVDTQENRKLSTGFKRLDAMLRYGLHKGSYFVDSMPQYLKNSFMQQMADRAAESGVDVLYISTELSRYDLMVDTISRLSYEMNKKDEEKAVSSMAIMTGEKGADIHSLKDELNWYRGRISEHLFVLDQEAVAEYVENMEDASAEEIMAELIRSIVTEGAHKPVVFIDNIENILSVEDSEDMKPLMEGIHKLAKELGIPIIMSYGYAQAESESELDPSEIDYHKSLGNMCDVYIELKYADMITEDYEELTEEDIQEMVEDGEMLLINVLLHKNRRTMKASCQIQATPKFNYYEE